MNSRIDNRTQGNLTATAIVALVILAIYAALAGCTPKSTNQNSVNIEVKA